MMVNMHNLKQERKQRLGEHKCEKLFKEGFNRSSFNQQRKSTAQEVLGQRQSYHSHNRMKRDEIAELSRQHSLSIERDRSQVFAQKQGMYSKIKATYFHAKSRSI